MAPGIGCPVIASITGADGALVVTEPTLSGIHDLERVLKLLEHFNVSPFVCVNMYDINTENTNQILGFCKKNGIEVVGIIPFAPEVTQAMINGKTVVEYAPESGVAEAITSIWKKLSSSL
jgi:MinD superfamily P-loop ATPase